jgi:nucleolysin TIA-1/TIAR
VTLANMSYEEIFAQTPLYNTSVYIRNLPKEIISKLLIIFFFKSLFVY